MTTGATSNLAPGQSHAISDSNSLSGVFVLTGAAGTVRFLNMTDAKSDAGVPITASAGSGAMGIARTAGTSLALLGEATSGSAKTNQAFWEFNVPGTYQPGANIPVKVNAAILGTGTLTAASCTLSVAAYTEINGVEAALTVTNSQTIVAAAGNYTFTITGTGLLAGAHLGLEITGLVTSGSGANTLEINSVGYTA